MKIDKRIQPLDRIVRYKFTILSFLGVAILGPILNFTLFSISRFDRLFLAIVFMSFVMIMILALTQLFMHVAIQYVNILGRRYKTESTYDPDAAKIAKAIKAPLPKEIVISENPAIDAVTNTLTGTITFSRRLKDQCTRDQFLAVAAHEIGHLKYRKRMILEMLGALGITVLYMILALKILSYVSPVMAELSGLGFFLLLITRIMHSGEFAADKMAHDAGLGQHLADVLTKFGDKYGYNKSSETHPSTGSRIKRLLRPQAGLPPLVSGLVTTPLSSEVFGGILAALILVPPPTTTPPPPQPSPTPSPSPSPSPTTAVNVSFSVTASDSEDPYLRYWTFLVDGQTISHTTQDSGATVTANATLQPGSHTLEIEISQSGGPSYGTYSGNAVINGQSHPFSGVDINDPANISFTL